MIDTFFKILKKSLLMTVMLMFAFVITYVPQIHTDETGQEYAANVEYAHAGASVVVEIGSNLLQNLYTAIQVTIQTIYKAWIYLKENVLDGIAWTIAKQFISNMVADVVDWINSGFQGSPAFVQDLDNFLLRSADEAVGQYIQELGGIGSFVCDPFRLDVQFAVALQYDLQREETRAVPECTVTDVFNNFQDFEDFIAGDFQRGGWEGWFQLTSEPQNTPYGGMLAAQTQNNLIVANTKGEQLNLLDFGSGFISIPFCENVPGPNGTIEQCSIVKPGDVVRDTLNESLGAGQESLIVADEFNEIIVALLGQLANQAIEGAYGLLGLSGGGGYSYTPYSRDVTFVEELRTGNVNISGGTSGDTVTPVSGGISSGLTLIRETIQALQYIQGSVGTYISSNDPNLGLAAFRNNTLNGQVERTTAGLFLDEARNIRTRVNSELQVAQPYDAAYAALDNEYPTATAARQAEIRNEQARLLQEFQAQNFMTRAEYDTQADQWDRLLARNVTPPNCFMDPWATGCPCNINPQSPQCSGGPGQIIN